MLARFLPITVLIVVLVAVVRMAIGCLSENLVLLQEQREREEALDKQFQALQLDARCRIYDRLLLGEMTLREAVWEIRSHTRKEDLDSLIEIVRLEDEGDCTEELLYKHVLRVVRYSAKSWSPRSEAIVERLEAELGTYLRRRESAGS
jgi:hypothetical protein